MSNRRVIFWLTVVTLAALAANVMLSWRAPMTPALHSHALLDPDFSVTAITLVPETGHRTVLKKDDRWTLVEPYAGTVDAQVVLRMLDAFAFAAVEDSLSESELLKLGRTRADFGLDTPRLRVSFSNAAGERREIAFGHSTPTSNEVYAVRAAAGGVLVVPRNVLASADLGSDAFRERAVFPYEPSFITGFDLKRPGESALTFQRRGEGWRVGDRTASTAKVRDFLAALADTRALSFVWPVGASNETEVVAASVLAGYGLDAETALSVNIHCQDATDRLLLLGRDAGEAGSYALIHGGSAVVTISPALRFAAAQGLQAFVDTRLFPIEESAVSSFSVARGETTYVVAREGTDGWRLDAPVAAPANAESVSLLVGRLLALTPSDLAPDGLKVSVSTNLPSFVVAPQSLLAGRRLEELRSREILKVDPTLVKRIVSTRDARHQGHPVAVVYARDRRTWSEETTAEKNRTVSERAVGEILSALGPLKARSIVTLKATSADLARFGLEDPVHILAVDQDRAGSVRRNILIGNPAPGGRYATVGSSEAVFVLSEKTVSALTAPLVED